MFDYVFPENGLMAYKEGKLIAQTVRATVARASAVWVRGWAQHVPRSVPRAVGRHPLQPRRRLMPATKRLSTLRLKCLELSRAARSPAAVLQGVPRRGAPEGVHQLCAGVPGDPRHPRQAVRAAHVGRHLRALAPLLYELPLVCPHTSAAYSCIRTGQVPSQPPTPRAWSALRP